MRKFKIVTQRTLYVGDTNVSELDYSDRIDEKKIECDSIKYNRDVTLITEDNLERAKNINDDYKVGDEHIGPLDSISFINGDIEVDNIIVLADPYYKLYEMKDGNYEEIDRHHHH